MIKLLSIISLGLGGYISFLNWYSIYATYKSKRNVSPIPILGALFLVLGLYGFQQTRLYAWTGILVDYGTLSLIPAIPAFFWDVWTTSNFNLVHRFISNTGTRHDDIRLFKSGKFIIKTKYDPPAPCNEHGALVTSKGLVGTWKQDGEGFCLEEYCNERTLKIKGREGELITEEQHYPDTEKYQYDRLGGLKLKQKA